MNFAIRASGEIFTSTYFVDDAEDPVEAVEKIAHDAGRMQISKIEVWELKDPIVYKLTTNHEIELETA